MERKITIFFGRERPVDVNHNTVFEINEKSAKCSVDGDTSKPTDTYKKPSEKHRTSSVKIVKK